MFSQTDRQYRRTSCRIEPRRDGSTAVKGTELNAEKGLVTKCFQEIKFILSLSEILAKVAFYQEKPKVELTG